MSFQLPEEETGRRRRGEEERRRKRERERERRVFIFYTGWDPLCGRLRGHPACRIEFRRPVHDRYFDMPEKLV